MLVQVKICHTCSDVLVRLEFADTCSDVLVRLEFAEKFVIRVRMFLSTRCSVDGTKFATTFILHVLAPSGPAAA